ncbi:MAG TPA: oligosaccharide flippase family protein [Candidatus Acidoferrales bacterium]|nr:oligosaccharide flippase family protein [Candidatus Acidoferrales bacterium]
MSSSDALSNMEEAIATAAIARDQSATQVCSAPAPDAASRKFIRDIAFSNLPVPFQKLQTYLWVVVLTRALGPAGFGAWSLFMVTLSTATTVSTMNCGSSLMRFMSGERSREEINQAFSTVLMMVTVAGLAVALIFVGLSKQLAIGIFRSAGGAGLGVLLGGAVIFNSLFEEMKNILRARRLNRSWACFSLARTLPETAVVIAAALFVRSASSACASYLAAGICSVIAGMVYLKARRGIRLVKPAMRLFVKYSKYGLPLLPGVFASTLSLGADKYVVSHFLGLKQVGIYGVCFAISAVVFFLTGPINDVLFPELSALYDAQQWSTFIERFRAVQKFVIGFAFGTAAILVAFPRQVLGMVAPKAFASGSTSLAVLGIQGIFMAFVLLYIVILNTRLRVWSTTWFWMASGAAIVLLDMALVPRIGILGAAFSQLIATAVGAFVLVGLHWDLFRRTFELWWLGKAALAFATVCLLAFVLQSRATTFAGDIVAIVTGMLGFVICLLLTGYLTVNEIRKFAAALL